MRDTSGKTQYGQRGVEQAFTSHFTALLGGQVELTDEVRAKLEAEVLLFESLHASQQADESHGEVPSLEEVADCVKALRNHAAPGEDCIDARML
jgi:hypothetical protein